MTAKKIIITTAILLGATSAGLTQSAWTTGSAADRERAGYASPYGSGSMPTRRALRRIHSNGLRAYGMVPQALPQSSDDPALVGGGSVGYNEMQRRAW